MEGFWHHCLARLEKELPAQQFTTWIRPLQVDPERSTEDELCLTAPNRFVLQWIKDRFLSRIETLAGEERGKPIRVSIALAGAEPEPAAPAAPFVRRAASSEKSAAPRQQAATADSRSNLIA
ncbi:MAG: chromosomal replication initiator protein DnaA, partial [Burkholderiales bacterium]|nr:chromosomal replication initiator protein DnaA [Burkholderiales bacterium]